jgi:hypothetical protein
MAKPWADVEASDTYQGADVFTRQRIKEQYFSDVVEPKVPKENVEAAKRQFFSPTPDKPINPTEGMSDFAKFMAGMGKGIKETTTGLFMSPEAVKESRRLDAPLMATGAGVMGNIAGDVTAAVPSMFVPGVNTVLGSGVLGGLFGLMQPSETGREQVTNVLTGALGSGLVTGAVKGVPALYNALVKPFTQSGQADIALNTINRFASDPNALERANTTQLVTGSAPSLAEATGDAGIAQLQRAARTFPEGGSRFAESLATRQAARLDALRGIAGEEGKKDFYVAMREEAADKLYHKAFDETPVLTPWVKGQITALQKRPSIQDALPAARARALEKGLVLDESNVTQVLHFTKMALDDEIGALTTAGKKGLANDVRETRDKLVSLMESKDFSPSYREARDTYKRMSEPINQMEVGEALYKKLQPALSDFGAERSTPGAFAQAVREGDRTAAAATGFRGATLAGTLSKPQLETVTNIAKDLGRFVKAEEQGKVPGSPTAQYLGGQQIMRSIMGPLGLPESWAQSFMAELLQRGTKFAGKSLGNPLESKIQERLTEMLLDPNLARQARIDAFAKQARMAPVNALVDRLLPLAAVGAGSYAAQ